MDEVKFKYQYVPNLLNENELNLLTNHCKNLHKTNTTNFDVGQSENLDTYFYKDPLMEMLGSSKKHIFEKVIGKKLHETYTFWRCYTFASDLKKHKDRRSCEISATVFIDADKNSVDWPIYMEGNPVTLKRGDAVLYKGCDVEHWREQFKGDYHIQVFLHYVDAEGEFKDHKGDVKNENNSK